MLRMTESRRARERESNLFIIELSFAQNDKFFTRSDFSVAILLLPFIIHFHNFEFVAGRYTRENKKKNMMANAMQEKSWMKNHKEWQTRKKGEKIHASSPWTGVRLTKRCALDAPQDADVHCSAFSFFFSLSQKKSKTIPLNCATGDRERC